MTCMVVFENGLEPTQIVIAMLTKWFSQPVGGMGF